jgi:glucokinase
VSPDPVALGIDIGGTKLVAATVATDGTVLRRHRTVTPANDDELLVDTVRSVITELGPELPVGIGIAGLVSPTGVVHYGPNIAVRDLPLAELAGEVTDAPVTVLNDASAAALGEQRVGAGRGHRDVVLFTLGTGVGGGLLVDGRLVVGRLGLAGELGHLIVVEGGRPCPCGNRGCIEAYASGTAIGLMARERLVDRSVETTLRDARELTGRSVTDAARDGDAFAQQLLGEVGTWLGVAAASLVNALDPELVLVGGGAAASSAPWVLPATEQALASRLIGSGWREPPPVQLTALGDDAGMVGAALYAAETAHPQETP